ncbi:PREDICTED: uncharacterized protein LOC105147973 isoform X3 [Acromyrmex echinatior]|uniref:uncharacterized protein LOC105147973 isoform X3 n=1 Tax=Acromyrmex echinatior TaxID=103372 RepID=UPI000580E119|nr:PREDICTED: uncharacterized protein LOC105147973 isoform X3 [Acromyrmex echinatior]
MEETVALIKSCIISKKGGVPITDLNDEFQILVGESIPYRRLGFASLRAFLQTIDGLETSWNNFGEQTLRINDSKISHIDKLIRKQKMDYSKTRNKYYKQFMRNGNLRHDDRRQKNRLIYNVDRINRRNQNFAQRRDLNLFGTNSLALHCGLCISGQTISDCTRALRNINTISNRVVILLGSVDVYNNATCEEMVYDMTELLQVLRSKFHLSNTAITICTLPPLANLSIYAHKKQSMALLSFNNWIRSLTDDPSKRDPSFINYLVIDLYEKFCFNETYVTNYDWYQTQARRVSGTKHSYVLWNMKGRKRAMSLICEEENTDQSRSPSSLPLQ